MTDIIDQQVTVATRLDVATNANHTGDWARVCRLDQLTPGRGAPARVAGRQVAVFRIPSGDGESVFALDNRDPFSGAHVLARGLVGDRGGVPKVTSPVYKQGFDLRTGVCLDDPEVVVPTYPVTVCDEGWVSVAIPATSP
ncbi:MAG: nitrite reductase small subunit NirD [Acidimicrobiales bacterium]|nr:nitrite reductase small subunit NirD [Acidimicrobiales bacterium]